MNSTIFLFGISKKGGYFFLDNRLPKVGSAEQRYRRPLHLQDNIIDARIALNSEK